MSKTLLLFLSIILIIAIYIFNIDRVIKSNLIAIQTSISNSYLNSVVFLTSNINKYFNQLDHIKQLQTKNEELERYKALFEISKNKVNELQKISDSNYEHNLSLVKTKVLSYSSFMDKSIVNLPSGIVDDNNITGLITYDGYSAGIVLNRDGNTLGFLNENEKCNYAVFIGKDNAPGITSGKGIDGRMLIKYIPLWKKIKKGDMVITSGMDSIFPYGVLVGKVTEVIKEENTQKAYVDSFSDTVGNRDYFIYLK